MPAVFDRYSNSFLKLYFEIPEGREDELARKVLIKHLQSGNSYGIRSSTRTASSPSPSWARGSQITYGRDQLVPARPRRMGTAHPLKSSRRGATASIRRGPRITLTCKCGEVTTSITERLDVREVPTGLEHAQDPARAVRGTAPHSAASGRIPIVISLLC